MLKILNRLYTSNSWYEDEEDTIERLKKYEPTSTLLKLEFLSSLSLDLSVTNTNDRYIVRVTLGQQEESFGGVIGLWVYRFIKFLSKPKSLLR
jgi:hypothetical protein